MFVWGYFGWFLVGSGGGLLGFGCFLGVLLCVSGRFWWVFVFWWVWVLFVGFWCFFGGRGRTVGR